MRNAGFLFLLAVVFAGPGASSPLAASKLALVYAGPGACPENCAEAAAKIAKSLKLSVRLVTPETVGPELLSRAAVWIQPGGNAIDVVRALSPAQLQLIRDFVSQGGGYLGFCAGAFLADHTVDDAETIPGLGLFPGTSRDYHVVRAVLPVLWGDKIRHLYIEEGGYFLIPPNSPVGILARYSEGYPAAIFARYGLGRVAVTGVHPEAPASWKTSSGFSDPDGPDYDLALDMLRMALGQRPIRKPQAKLSPGPDSAF